MPTGIPLCIYGAVDLGIEDSPRAFYASYACSVKCDSEGAKSRRSEAKRNIARSMLEATFSNRENVEKCSFFVAIILRK